MNEALSSTPGDLRQEIRCILGGKGMSNDLGYGPDYKVITVDRTTAPAERRPFVRWHLMQVERGGLVGDPAKGAMADRRFPATGTRKRFANA
jgi:hypothetical protein